MTYMPHRGDFPTAPTDNITRRLCVGRITEATPGE